MAVSLVLSLWGCRVILVASATSLTTVAFQRRFGADGWPFPAGILWFMLAEEVKSVSSGQVFFKAVGMWTVKGKGNLWQEAEATSLNIVQYNGCCINCCSSPSSVSAVRRLQYRQNHTDLTHPFIPLDNGLSRCGCILLHRTMHVFFLKKIIIQWTYWIGTQRRLQKYLGVCCPLSFPHCST